MTITIHYPTSVKEVDSLFLAKELLRRDVPNAIFTELQPWEILVTLPASTKPSRHMATIFLDNSKQDCGPFDGGLPTKVMMGGGVAEYAAKKSSIEDRLTTLLKALAEYYPNDSRVPGVITAWLGDQRGWYAAVHRFPPVRMSDGHSRGERTVIVKVEGKFCLSETYREAAKQWLAQIGSGVSVEALKKDCEIART